MKTESMHAIKLTNPPNEELNIAFALEVAGWKFSDPEVGSFLVDPKDGLIRNPPDFCSDANAVLPHFEKAAKEIRSRLWAEIDPKLRAEWMAREAMPRTMVLSLLLKKGVQVEITQ